MAAQESDLIVDLPSTTVKAGCVGPIQVFLILSFGFCIFGSLQSKPGFYSKLLFLFTAIFS